MKISNHISKRILSLSAALLLSAVTAQGAFAMGSPTHTTTAQNLGATTADLERNGSFHHIAGRVGWVTDPGARADTSTAQAEGAEDVNLVAMNVRGGQ